MRQARNADPEIELQFKRNAVSDLPKRLESLASRQADAKRASGIVACSKLFHGLLDGNPPTVRLSRAESRWRWLIGVAKEAGAHTFATVVDLKLYEYETAKENAAEKRKQDELIREAAEAYRQGGGE